MVLFFNWHVDAQKYFEDLTAGFRTTKNRARHFIANKHWPSDGAWKESILRNVLRGFLPSRFSVSSGFIKGKNEVSNQIDVLIYDDSGPVLFRDEGFIVVPPNIVRAVIQVKTRITSSAKFGEALNQLIATIQSMRGEVKQDVFYGLFVYDNLRLPEEKILKILQEKNSNEVWMKINALSFGDSKFTRFWRFHPYRDNNSGAKVQGRGGLYNSWHAYDLDKTAPGYFIHNIIEHLFPGENYDHLYPPQGKEQYFVARMTTEGVFSETPP